MRLFLSLVLMLSATTLIAQDLTVEDFYNNGLRKYDRNVRSASDSAKKWSLNTFSGISTSFVGWKGGYATVVSAPLGVQLTRRIDNNFFAFGAVSVAPSYISFNQRFMNTDLNKSAATGGFMRSNSFGINPRAELGLGYTNDEKTFQISASIGVSRSEFPYQMGSLNQWNNNSAFNNSYNNQGFYKR
ncbi:MAG: hypothetical protein JWQ96_2209 [Segetibacter sp.]|nr:hypothetical protein [Segetibacter sp.]